MPRKPPTLAVMLTVFLSAGLLSGCNGTGRGDYCAIASPILISRADVLTDQTARSILAANETWRRLCD